MNNKEYIGEKINEWEIIDYKNDEHGGKWLCRCKCGEEKWQKVYNIKNNKSKMCKKCSSKNRIKVKEKKEKIIRIRFDSNKGWEKENVFEGTYKEYLEECKKRREKKKEGSKYVPYSYDRKYKIWQHMKERCNNVNLLSYKYYGGRGIKVCDEWEKDYFNFKDWAIKNGYNENLSIDRIDVNGNYEPNNCRWVTMKQQQRNKRNNHYINYQGKTQTAVEWSEELGIDYDLLLSRINRGVPFEKAIMKDYKEANKQKYIEKRMQIERRKQIRALIKVIRKLRVEKYKNNEYAGK